MSAVWIDPEAATRTAHAWVEHADRLQRTAFEVEHRLGELALGEHTSSMRHLGAAAIELWLAATVTRHAVDAARRGDAFDPHGALVGLTALVQPSHVHRVSSASGDAAGTNDREVRSPYDRVGATPATRARHLLGRALADTVDATRIRADEFGLVRLDARRFVVVLPGVVDLSSPDRGWTEPHRSVRDLDRAAFASSRSSAVADNPFAGAVWSGLLAAGVPAGSELLVIGHSFGADTALDLAADPGFNGPGGYRVTHVLAAGYHSAPQLPFVPLATEVLVLQNHRDVPVILEAIGDAHVTEALVSTTGLVAAIARIDPVGAARHHARSVRHQLGALWSGVAHVVSRADDLADVALGITTIDPSRTRAGAAGFVTLEPGVRTTARGQVVSVFEGGGDEAGHHPEHYVAHLQEVGHPAVTAFLESVDMAGYTAPGIAVAVDVSVPSS